MLPCPEFYAQRCHVIRGISFSLNVPLAPDMDPVIFRHFTEAGATFKNRVIVFVEPSD